MPATKITPQPSTRDGQDAPALADDIKDTSSKSSPITTREVAEALDTDPRTLRKFLRSDVSTIDSVGRGKRYEFTKGDIDRLRPRFDAWVSANARPTKADEALRDELSNSTVKELKAALDAAGIDYPSSAKKANLIDAHVRERNVLHA